VVGGLQAGLRIADGSGTSVDPGERIQFETVVRNVTDKDIAFIQWSGKLLKQGAPIPGKNRDVPREKEIRDALDKIELKLSIGDPANPPDVKSLVAERERLRKSFEKIVPPDIVNFHWIMIDHPDLSKLRKILKPGQEGGLASTGFFHRGDYSRNSPDSLAPGKYRICVPDALMHAKNSDNPELTTGYIEIEVRQRPAKANADPTAWGSVVDGLQAGLRITEGHGRRLGPGEQVQLEVVVKNLTDRDISFVDHPGKRLALGESKASGETDFNWMAIYSGPGPIDFPTVIGAGSEFRVGTAGIFHRPDKTSNTWDSRLSGKYRVRAANVLMHAAGNDKNPDLATGIIDIEILAKGAKLDDVRQEAPAWGEQKNGVRVGIAAASSARIAVAFENVGKDDIMVNVGMMLANGKKQLPTAIRLTAVDSQNRRHVLLHNLPGVAGRVDPFLVPLPAGSRYSLPVALSNYTSDFTDGKLPAGSYKLTAECAGGPIDRPNADVGGLATFPLWSGPAVSGETTLVVPEEKK
jgi:hypothetical protein